VKINLVTVKIAIVKNANVKAVKLVHALLNQVVVVATTKLII